MTILTGFFFWIWSLNQSSSNCCVKINYINFTVDNICVSATMPLQGLPLVLEITLDTLLTNNALSSWQIKGGPKFSQVTIRFSAMAAAPSNTEVQYRRAPPSRIARDRQRAFARSDTTVQYQQEEHIDRDSNNGEEESTQMPANIREQANIATMDNSSPPVLAACQPSAAADDNMNGQSGMTERGVTVSLNNIDMSGDSVKSEYADIQETSITNDGDSDSSEGGTFSCDGCGGMMSGDSGMVWYRCTECDDVDICTDCFLRNVHGHHKRHIHKFVCPVDWNSCYCDSCGVVLNVDAVLFSCRLCEDYCLCGSCKKQRMHIKHNKHLTLDSVTQYDVDIK